MKPSIAFGPVPSRRLGRSLGVNLIPPKSCTYSCLYCQVGLTQETESVRRPFYETDAILESVGERLDKLVARGTGVDHISIVPDGEPTLDLNLGRHIEGLKRFGIPVAVISNASLAHRSDVRDELSSADWVSMKVDSVRSDEWRAVNRPHSDISHAFVLSGIEAFRSRFTRRFVTETMLIEGVNTGEESLSDTAAFLARLRPERSYILIPTRPPASATCRPASEEDVARAHEIFSRCIGSVELLVGFEGKGLGATGDAESDLLSVAAVHPLREDAALDLLKRNGETWDLIDRLVYDRRIRIVEYRGHRYLLRAWS